jgi:hypothetical protein
LTVLNQGRDVAPADRRSLQGMISQVLATMLEVKARTLAKVWTHGRAAMSKPDGLPGARR